MFGGFCVYLYVCGRQKPCTGIAAIASLSLHDTFHYNHNGWWGLFLLGGEGKAKAAIREAAKFLFMEPINFPFDYVAFRVWMEHVCACEVCGLCFAAERMMRDIFFSWCNWKLINHIIVAVCCWCCVWWCLVAFGLVFIFYLFQLRSFFGCFGFFFFPRKLFSFFFFFVFAFKKNVLIHPIDGNLQMRERLLDLAPSLLSLPIQMLGGEWERWMKPSWIPRPHTLMGD